MRDPGCDALLLLGPTGSGKTPLGRQLELRGFRGRRCVHFDFGHCLRTAVAGAGEDWGLAAAEVEYLRDVLASGALLDDRDFPIAERILLSFLARSQLAPGDLVVLNGLPRHTGQAVAIADILAVREVVCLECSPQSVRERIRRDTGGDRRGRPDDDLPAIERKLAIYDQRTAPLIDFYKTTGAEIIHLQVAADTAPESAWETLQHLA